LNTRAQSAPPHPAPSGQRAKETAKAKFYGKIMKDFTIFENNFFALSKFQVWGKQYFGSDDAVEEGYLDKTFVPAHKYPLRAAPILLFCNLCCQCCLDNLSWRIEYSIQSGYEPRWAGRGISIYSP
jgi:hypothetical protein